MLWSFIHWLVTLAPEVLDQYEMLDVEAQLQGAWMIYSGGIDLPEEIKRRMVYGALVQLGFLGIITLFYFIR